MLFVRIYIMNDVYVSIMEKEYWGKKDDLSFSLRFSQKIKERRNRKRRWGGKGKENPLKKIRIQTNRIPLSGTINLLFISQFLSSSSFRPFYKHCLSPLAQLNGLKVLSDSFPFYPYIVLQTFGQISVIIHKCNCRSPFNRITPN